MLKELFTELLHNYTNDDNRIIIYWTEIEKNYSGKGRYYHTLQHLDHLLNQLIVVKSEIKDWDVVLFTLYYHDIVYNSRKSDNEEKSAELAEERMKQISVPAEVIELCKKQILATKSHLTATDQDTNYFTDIDLSILGQDWNTYSDYYKNVRKEYAVYPDFLYNPGRKKVLQHFLAMDRIFKTDLLYDKFELRARQNMQKEMELL
ncbi:HD domain-containing protein [Flavobacterium cerinum]|uniref:Metal-dependent HD superfamily phosphohydrolase n=1 Tax=Flavobacterium cerinum TaxID=2502784 RepID=A0ABY5IVA6_9FLAO|nr:hypothetical protein [Flavobacterium cerinum]UUC46755.1 hypothetical protein NOX80_06025 [Flavobacterium cerinum]